MVKLRQLLCKLDGDFVRSRRFRRGMQVGWIASALVFLGIYTVHNWEQSRDQAWLLDENKVIVAALFALIWRLIGGLRWMPLAEFGSSKDRGKFSRALRIFLGIQSSHVHTWIDLVCSQPGSDES